MYEITKSEFRSELVINAVFWGEFDRSIALKFIDELVEYEKKYPGHKLLADFSDVSNLKIDIKDLMSISEYVEQNDHRSGKTAFVTGPRLGRYLIAKLYVDMVGLFKSYQESAFKDKSEAINWLCPKAA